MMTVVREAWRADDVGSPSLLTAAIRRTLTYLERERHPNGTWRGRLSSSALATSMALLCLRRGTTATERNLERAAAWLAATQRADGSWGDAETDEGTVNSTALAVAALVDHDRYRFAQHIDRGKRWLASMGGFATINDPQKASLSGPGRTMWAEVGLVPWESIRRLPLEIVLLPEQVRRTVSTTFPAFLSLSILHDRHLRYSLPRRIVRRLVRRWAIQWLRRAQSSDGGFEEAAFLTALVGLCLRETAGHDVASRCERFVLASQREDGSWPIDRDLESFDSALTIVARSACGDRFESPPDKALQRWFYESQFQEECFATGAPPGGWAWARPGGWPDLDDTTAALRALLLLGTPPEDPAVERSIEFLRAMQNRDGSWATFVKNSSVPFDLPCPYVTGHTLTAFAEAGFTVDDPAVSRAVRFLHRVQHRDGSFDAVWFRNATSGTASVVEALTRLGLQDTEMMSGALQWLLSAQDVSGGWGDGLRSSPTAEETSWALIALLSVNRRTPSIDAACERGVSWLLETQRPDGTWSCTPLGFYFSTLRYSDSFFAVALSLQALGMFRAMRGEADDGNTARIST
ncbi:MAG: hypothetical protein M1396_02935 [Chloroflexi bacterium]|nr:hypothetical protein [Chloroflexota bacterium]